MKTAYKLCIVAMVTMTVLLLSSSVIKCPVPAIRDLFFVPHSAGVYRHGNGLSYFIAFNPGMKAMEIHQSDSKTLNRTVLRVIVEDDHIKIPRTATYTKKGMDLALSQSKLVIKKVETERSAETPVCYNVTARKKTQRSRTLTHCLAFQDDFWFGGAEMYEQRWPINVNMKTAHSDKGMVFYPFISHNFGDYPFAPGSVLERYWLSSSGVAIFIDRSIPLQVGFNKTHLCFKTARMSSRAVDVSILRYTVCVGGDIKTIHQFMAKRYWPNPTGVPDSLVTKNPIWTTWALYKRNINQSTVLQYAEDIRKHYFPVSHIEIDDMFSSRYGDFDFDKKKFPDPARMIKTLHQVGCRVSAWIHPFMNTDSVNFALAKKLEYLVWKDDSEERKEPLITKWWDGEGALLDFTNKAAVKWYFDRRKTLDKLGMDSYKYDAGESSFLRRTFATNRTLTDPNQYGSAYATAAFEYTNNAIEVRVGYVTQNLPIFVRVMDMNSVWSGDRGLDVLIPTVLHFGLIGYPFVLPDMIGGNFYQGQYPTKELFIRWTQITAFLPSMQFSIVPWAYDQEVVEICRDLVKLHVEYVTPLLLKWGKVAVQNGDPIIRPTWWIAPTDKNTFNDSTTFLIGNDVLVAPIILPERTHRNIYLPKGTWKDMLRNKIIRGPIMLKDYSVPLKSVAYFELMKQKKLFTARRNKKLVQL
uniref:Target of brain insulin-like 2 alpha glucosidase n=1 Tax=Platynereis dumerilii TaxID=6359 RepID=A0A6B9MF49_PLADU|nr:target of brain insulin-like 2 alpha glucosidase [Platynereis dumerilii]